MIQHIRNYLRLFVELSKVRIALLAAFSAAAGFMTAADRLSSGIIAPVSGIFLLACGALSLNQYQERNSDALMDRTRSRPLPSGRVKSVTVILFSLSCIAAGFLLLFFSVLSSGSSQQGKSSKVVIVPCSMGTLGRIAAASGSKLIERIADVALKERRRLVVVPRETPLHSLHLKNMLELSSAGAVILPAMPGFYQKPGSVDDIINFMVSKILDALDIPNELSARWGN